MSEFLPEEPVVATAFVPVTDEPPDPVDALQSLESALTAFAAPPDLIVAAEPPPPVGRAWAYDWQDRRFHTAGASSPLTVRGMQTLRGWIEKCLRTERGAHPVHPPGYGLVGGVGIGGPVGVVAPDLEGRVREALTFHPRISDVTNFSYDHDPDDDYLAVTFDVLLDGGADEIAVNNLQLGS